MMLMNASQTPVTMAAPASTWSTTSPAHALMAPKVRPTGQILSVITFLFRNNVYSEKHTS